ncbi:hypothetical protein UFOVP399_42 [uncultured Caudovirales phage]|uniref:Uncharacterized protein n=1 Tax=uncultured Caudovirales phage TaxID=2100421 RepID=A0A6J5M400_9CAUD|nr:hypothetical protein UFOVP399_42 [uncultured Caudovirales phage]
MSDEALRAELAKKAKKAGIKVEADWTAADIEDAIAVKELEDAEKAPPATEPPAFVPPAGQVKCRVTKAGDGKIFTGREDQSFFAWNDEVWLPPSVAKDLEARYFVEIQP